MRRAEAAGYEVLLTVDGGFPLQRSGSAVKISILLIDSRSNDLEDLLPLAGSILRTLSSLGPGQIVSVP
jgi:hypothetical protein